MFSFDNNVSAERAGSNHLNGDENPVLQLGSHNIRKTKAII